MRLEALAKELLDNELLEPGNDPTKEVLVEILKSIQRKVYIYIYISNLPLGQSGI